VNRFDSLLDRPPRELRLSAAQLGDDDAPPVLVLHGMAGSRRYWIPRIRPLAGRYRLLIPDLPGFGHSPKPFVDYTMDFFIEVLSGYLDRTVDGQPLRIVAHSMGGLIGIELAARFPGRVQSLALLSVPRYTSPETAHQMLITGSASYRSILTVNSLAATWRQLRRCGWRLTARSLRRMPWGVVADSRKFTFRSASSTIEHCVLQHRIDPSIDALPANLPVLLIQGDRDIIAPLDPLRELCDRPPHPTLHVVERAGHNLYHTHTSECMALIERFLE